MDSISLSKILKNANNFDYINAKLYTSELFNKVEIHYNNQKIILTDKEAEEFFYSVNFIMSEVDIIFSKCCSSLAYDFLLKKEILNS